MKINHYWEKQIGGTHEDFIEFVKVATDDLTEEDIDDIDFQKSCPSSLGIEAAPIFYAL